MRPLEQINYILTSDSIILYWDKPREVPAQYRYQVYVGGSMIGTSQKTHYEINGLVPDTEYEVQVKLLAVEGEGIEDSGTGSVEVGDSGSLVLRTERLKKRIDVTKAPYYAVGDGKTMNTAILQQAIDDCKEGEAVYLPEGVYLTGALRLHSNMELYLEEGAVLQGTDKVEDYLPKIKSRFEGIENESYSSLLNLGELDHGSGYNCSNVVIRGKGVIASGGRTLAERVIASEREKMKDYLAQLGDRIKECEKPETIPGRVRPRLINMSNCENIVLMGVTLKNGASWNVHMIYSHNIVTSGCTFYSENVWNGDGWDPDSSTNCTIFNCVFHTGDDSIAVKSGKNPEGNKIGRPTEHIRIFDCRAAFGHGITIGSEMSGGIDDVAVWDCDMSNTLCGIEIKGTKKRGGYVRNVQVRDCQAARVLFHSVGYNDDGVGAGSPPVFEKCSFEHLHILGEYFGHEKEWMDCDAIELCGFDEPGHELKDILFEDVVIGSGQRSRKQVISMQYCKNITMKNISCL